MWLATTSVEARRLRRAMSGTVAFVPTMGALHDGHLSLIDAGRRIADAVVVSIFVNPTQFGPHEDFGRYPRPIEQDMAMCEAAGVAGVFNPPVEEMYPPLVPACDVNVPVLTTELEAAMRPGHFQGVCRVVAKLFNIIQPDMACFGMKDYQQFAVISAMTRDLNLPIDIVPCPTHREPDGLAMSSRNRYLDAPQRQHAVGLHKALQQARHLVEVAGETDPAIVEAAMRQVIVAHHFDVIDYATLRHPQTLATIDAIDPALTGGVVALVAARMGTTRLLDNFVLGQ